MRVQRAAQRDIPAGVVHTGVEGLSHDGRGIARLDGKTVFIEGALPGEEISFRYLRRRRAYDEAQVLEIHRASPHRVEPRCSHFATCGGCAMQHLMPTAQLAIKQQALLDNLRRIGHVQPAEVLPPLTAPVWGYRRRARLSVRHVPAEGRVLIGFVGKNTPHVTDTRRCETLDPRVGELILPLAELLNTLSIADRIPQIEAAVDEVATVLVLRLLSGPSDADRKKLSDFERKHSVYLYLQPGSAETAEPLSGDRVTLSYRLVEWDVQIAFEPGDFIQVNSEINRQLVKRAIELLQVESRHQVLDLFCGLGNFTLPLARLAESVTDVEGEEGLVKRARANAQRNALNNVSFYQADLFADQSRAIWLRQPYDRLLLDPPRTGAHEILDQLGESGPPRIVYVSCHPATLARDAGTLVHARRYRLLAAGVLDMFPHTAHVESMAVFTREGAVP
ncbi:MAG: 23S rRNA (uracil(1939)-C(5))-methyltransferase RlmD [Gammaproteobacteria bacterium]